MLKTTLAVGLATSAEVGDEKQDGKRIQVDGNKKKPVQLAQSAQKSFKGQLKGQETAKSKNWIRAEKSEASRAKDFSSQSGSFLTSKARKTFTNLKQEFVEAPILNHFDPECHIRIETDTSSYAIGEIFSQLTLDDLGRWHPIVFFSRKMISTETRYETHDGELLAIVKAFKV